MLYRVIRRAASRCVALPLAFLLIAGLSLSAQDTDKRGRKFKAPPPTARIEVTILRDFNGKPIENAAVVFHPMQGEKDKGNMELKTNEDGKAVIDVLPIGDTVRLQVIAKGFQTFGDDYKIDKSQLAIEVRLKRPGEQYSIYKAHAPGADPNAGQGKVTQDGSSSDDSAGATKDPSADSGKGTDSSNKPSGSGKDTAKDKPSDSSSQQPSQPSQPQPQRY